MKNVQADVILQDCLCLLNKYWHLFICSVNAKCALYDVQLMKYLNTNKRTKCYNKFDNTLAEKGSKHPGLQICVNFIFYKSNYF